MKIGIDIGGTSIRIGAIENGKIVNLKIFDNNVKEFETILQKIFSNIDEMIDNNNLEFIGIALPGPLDIESGIILNTPNLESWNNKNIKQLFKDKYNVEVKINNDANVAALGQYIVKSKKEKLHSILYFTISTGFGAGFVHDGKIFSGSKGLALEVYNSIPDINSDNVAKSGIEFIASGKNIAINLIKSGINISSSKEAFEIYNNKKNEIVNNYFSNMKKSLIQFFLTAVYFFNPSKIILGGSVALANKSFYIDIFKEAEKILNVGGFSVKLDFAENIDESTLIGCSQL